MTLLQLSGQVDDRDQQITDLEREVGDLRRELLNVRAELKQTITANSRAVANLRRQLSPLYQALRQVFGEMEGMIADESAEAGPQLDSRKKAVWESWKNKLRGKQAEFIDVLLHHGEMSATQLKIATKSGQQTVYDTIHKLNQAGLINKNGGRFSLKEL